MKREREKLCDFIGIPVGLSVMDRVKEIYSCDLFLFDSLTGCMREIFEEGLAVMEGKKNNLEKGGYKK